MVSMSRLVIALRFGLLGNSGNITKAVSRHEKLLFYFGVFMERILSAINAVVWGIPTLLLILSVGLYLSVKSKFAQFRLFPLAMKQLFGGINKGCEKTGETSAYRALCTALAATVGTGNIAGVAGAIALGGPGVVFWMWVCACIGMVIKLAEVTLAIHFRTTDQLGKYIGGPMYMIERGLPKSFRWLACLYCFFGVVAAFGVGNATQINAVICSIADAAASLEVVFTRFSACLVATLVAVLVAVAFWKDNGRIGIWAEALVPFASVGYILLSCSVLIARYHRIPFAVRTIILGAFSPTAVTNGVLCSALLSLRVGASRGIFTNEAGMGTASIAHAAAAVSHPVDQGIMGIIEVFLDTIVICTMTALVILCSGVEIRYGTDPGVTLSIQAFSAVLGDWSKVILSALICIFAFATILGWGLYGRKCAQYLLGDSVWRLFTAAQVIGIVLSSLLNTSVVWVLSEIVNGLMAIPNLVALIWLSPVFLTVLSNYGKRKNAYRT